jgi:phytanoyl-CoA hydroxylase
MQSEAAIFHSKFGGPWYDNRNAQAVAARITQVSDRGTRERLEFFIRWGYVVLENAISHYAIEKYLARYNAAAANLDMLVMSVPHGPMSQTFIAENALIPGAKVLDTASLFSEGDDLSFSLPLSMFLQELLDGPVLAFQSLHFEVGSTQAVHQDTAYVVVDDQPMQMVASWIALEDVQPGSGELVYFAGGHRLPDFPYGAGESKHFNFERDGNDRHIAHLKYLAEESERQGYERRSFLPKKGDVLIWHADLPHGGGKIINHGITRRSLVTHYCPAGLTPHYFQFVSPEKKLKVSTPSGNFVSSMYYPSAHLGC